MHSLEFITDTETRNLVVTPAVKKCIPNIEKVFEHIDQKFLDDPKEYLKKLDESVFTFKNAYGSEVACSILCEQDSQPDELMVIFAPFADCEPKSTHSDLSNYLDSNAKGIRGSMKKEKVAPNTWNQTTKSAVVFDLLEAVGRRIPVLTIYSPLPTSAYSPQEKNKIKSGNFSPAARIAREAIEETQTRLHGKSGFEVFDKIHLSGASLGASNAIGATEGLNITDHKVLTVTAQELILGPKTLSDLANRYIINQIVGEPSDETDSLGKKEIKEPEIRRRIDFRGSEIIGTNKRALQAMKSAQMRGLTKPEETIRAIERLLDDRVSLLIALAENSALTHETLEFLPNNGELTARIKGRKGERIGHITNEHVALSALIMICSVMRHRPSKEGWRK